jgi:hypothetical protein
MNNRDRRDRGQSLAFFALVLTLLMGFMALGLDAGNLFIQRRDAQSVADLAALAGARDLPGAPTSARTVALAIAAANGYPTGACPPVVAGATCVTVTTPYGLDTRRIEVQILRAVPTFFMPILGVPTVDVGARAVARAESTSTAAHAIFAGRSTCPDSESYKTLDWSGSNINVVGEVHSNEGILVGGSGNSVTGATTYVCTSEFDGGGSTNRYTPAAQKVAAQPWPVTYTTADFPCTYPTAGPRSGTWDLSVNGEWWVGGNASLKLLKPGVYCATGPGGIIKLGYSGITGSNVTFVATEQVEISGSNFVLTPHTKGVLIYSQGTSDTAVKISASGGAWAGMIYAPRGTAEVSGSENMTLAGSIVADRVKLNGSNFTITAGTTSSGVNTLQLVE